MILGLLDLAKPPFGSYEKWVTVVARAFFPQEVGVAEIYAIGDVGSE